MSEEEQSELFKKVFTNTLIKLAKEPEELFDNDKLQKKYNNLLREQIKLKKQLQQKENIIKEAINYIKEESWFCYKDNEEVIDRTPVNKLLEILGDNDE